LSSLKTVWPADGLISCSVARTPKWVWDPWRKWSQSQPSIIDLWLYASQYHYKGFSDTAETQCIMFCYTSCTKKCQNFAFVDVVFNLQQLQLSPLAKQCPTVIANTQC